MSGSLLTAKGTAIARPSSNCWWVLFAVAVGVLFLVATMLPLRFFLAFFTGLLVLPVALATSDRKRFFLIILVLALPLGVAKTFAFTASTYFRSAFGYTVYLPYLPLLALYFIWVFRRVYGDQPMPISTKGLVPLAGLCGIAVISTALISEPAASKMYAVFNLFDLAFSVLIFIYMASEIREKRELRLVVTLVIIIGVLQALIAIGQNLTGTFLGLGFLGARKPITGYLGLLTLSRVTGTLGHPALLAEFFDITIPISFSLLFYPMSRPLKLLLGLAVIFEFIGTGMSYSRGSISWTLVACSSILLFHLCRRLGLARGVFTTLSVCVMSGLLLLVVPNPLAKGLLRTEPGTAYGRLPLMEVAYNMISHHPLLGVGLSNYVQVALKYDFTPEQLTASWNSAVHNVYLFLAGEIGLIGLFFFLSLLATVLWRLWPTLRSADPLIACAGLGVLAALLVISLHWLTDLSTWASNRFFWFTLGLAISVRRIADATPASIPGTKAAAAG